MKTFEKLFTGNTHAFGLYILEDKIENKPKRGGKAITKRLPVKPRHYAAHLSGETGLGIVPINEDDLCVFGALDVDDYKPGLAEELNRRVRSMYYSHEKFKRYVDREIQDMTQLPLVVCRTKSGGAHLYMFCEPTPAKIVRAALKSFAVALGEYPCEVFPKQDTLNSNDVGNWINLPYFDADNTDRYALDANGEPLSFDEFVEYANEMIVPVVSPLILNDGPPCLQRVVAEGVPDGTRNTTLFNVGSYYKKKDADNFEEDLSEFNFERVADGYLKSSEVLTTTKSLKRKDYKYQCEDVVLEPRCQRSICEKRAFGVGPQAPALSALTLPDDAVVLPGGPQSITDGATSVFTKLETDGEYIRRGKFVYHVDYDKKETEYIGPEELRSRIETAGRKKDGTRSTWRAHSVRDTVIYKQDIAILSDTKGMLASPAVSQLTNVKGISTSPIILRNGHVITSGLQNDVLILCNQEFTKIPLEEARAKLLDPLRDYQFRSGGDLSRCVAAMFTPLLRISGLIGGHAPMTVFEANQSHAGKTKLAEIVFAIYGDSPIPVVTKDREEGGVGGMTELLGNAFMNGRNFVFIDNLRTDGAFQNAYLEAAVTRSGEMPVRLPYAVNQHIDVSRTSVVVTANDLSLNRDLANRANMVMIEKRPDKYNFHNWGQELERHVRANHVEYFNCVASIVQTWILEHDMKETDSYGMQHDFRPWACKVDYICRNLLELDPPFHDYRQVQMHKVNTEMTWLEDLCDAVKKSEPLTTSELYDLSIERDVLLPAENYRKLGFVLRRLMKKSPSITVLDRFEFERYDEWDSDRRKEVKKYQIRERA